MQIPGLSQAKVQDLPSAPLMPRLVLEEPLTLTLVFAAAAVVGWFVLNRVGKARRAAMVALVGAGLAIGVQVLARAVTTDREQMLDATRELVRVTAHADTAALRPLLAPEVRLTNEYSLAATEVQGANWGREEILSNVQKVLKDKYPLKEAAILQVQGIKDRDGAGRTQVRVRAVLQNPPIPIISWWRIEWVKKEGAWVVRGIEPMDLGIGGAGG